MPRSTDLLALARGLDALRANPMRTFLATLGVVIGVGALVSVLSLGDGMEAYAREQVAASTGVQTVTISPRVTRQVDGFEVANEGYPVFTERDAITLERRIPNITGADLTATGQSVFRYSATGQRYGAPMIATLANHARVADLEIANGRFFSETESARDAAVVVLSHGLAARLAAPAAAASILGERVHVGDGVRRVVGILKEKEIRDRAFGYVPLSAAARVFLPGPPIAPTLTVQSRTIEGVATVRSRVEDWLAERYGRWENGVEVSTSQERLREVSVAMLVFKIVMGAIAGISLLVGGIGIMNVLLASVAERTREIGIRRAVGARKRDVKAQFLAESAAIAMLGSCAGAPLGLAVAFGITAAVRASLGAEMYAGFAWGTVGFAVLAATLIALAFGTYPARRAARISPIDAIRHE